MFGKTISEKILFSLLYLVTLTPLIISSKLLFPYVTGKAFYFRFLVTASFITWVVVMISNKEYRPKKSPILIAFISFVSVMFVADIFGVNPGNSFFSRYERMEGFVTLGYLLTYFIVAASSFNTKEKWANFFKVSIWVSIYISGYAFLQKVGFISIRQGDVRLDGTFGNAIYLAIYMMFHFFITLLYAYKERLSKWKLSFYSVAMFLQLATMYFTASRGVLLGTVISLFAITLSLALFEKGSNRIRKISLIAFIAVTILVGGLFVSKDTDFVQENSTLSRFANISLSEGTIGSRFLIWDLSIEGFKENPILGYGQENFNYVFNDYYTSDLHAQEPWFDRAHNVIIDWLIAGGILGLLSYLSLFATALFLIHKNKTLKFVEKNILFGLIFAYGFNNFFVFDNILSYILFFSVLGYIHTSYVEKKETKKISEDSKYIIASVCILLAIFSFFAINGKGYAQGKTLIKAMQITVNNGRVVTAYTQGPIENIKYYQKALEYDSYGTGETVQNLTQTTTDLLLAGVDPNAFKPFIDMSEFALKKQIEDDPNNVLYYFLASRFYAVIGRNDEALSYISKAREMTPEKQDFPILQSRILLLKGEEDMAINIAREAYEINIESNNAWINYITTAYDVGETALVEELLSEAYSDGIQDRVDKYLEFMVRQNPEDSSLREKLISSYITFNKYDLAIKEIQKAQEDFPQEKEKFNNILMSLIK